MSNSPTSRRECWRRDAIDNPKGTAAGITFFGQFIDHDLTLDNEPQPTDTVDVEGLVNGRTFAFDLDSVYGGGPKKSPQLYDGDKFLIGTATDGVSPDLPRNARWLRNPGGATQRREPHHRPDSPVVPQAAQLARRPGDVLR